MQTDTEIPSDKALWLKQRRKLNRTLLVQALFFLALLMAGLWRDERDSLHWRQEAAQYRLDCSKPAATSSNCQLIPMQVYEHTSKTSLDPDDSSPDLWLGLQSKSGKTYRAEIYNPQWDQIQVGDSVTATVWKGKIVEVGGGGVTKETQANPTMRAGGSRFGVTLSRVMLAVGIFLVALLFVIIRRSQKSMIFKPGQTDSEE